MRSPFPGMDPYLEDRWRDVHSRLVLYGCDQLQQQVMPAYRARVEERVILDLPIDDREPPSFSPDIRIVRHRRDVPASTPTIETAIATAEPLVVLMPESQSLTETYIQIIDPRSNGKVVTVIEFLSPSNKRRGKDLDDYRAKQAELLSSDISLVEVDLLRAGVRSVHYDFDRWPDTLRLHYAACASRPGRRRRAELYGFTLREKLPAIRIPLSEGDRDAVLDLQKLVDQAYANGGYDDIDYVSPPVPPLVGPDDVWADALLRGEGKRT